MYGGQNGLRLWMRVAAVVLDSLQVTEELPDIAMALKLRSGGGYICTVGRPRVRLYTTPWYACSAALRIRGGLAAESFHSRGT